MILSMIVAMGPNREIGLQGKIPWHHSDDLKHFKKITLGHHMVMGRKTFESIGRVLPKRTTLILSRDQEFLKKCQDKSFGEGEYFAFSSLDEAMNFAKSRGEEELFLCGGGEIYQQYFSLVKRLYLSKIEYQGPCDVRLFEWDFSAWKQIEKEVFANW